MATCKDCINYTECNNSFLEDLGMALDPEREICGIFKDRSQFVKVPCKVGEHLYVPIPKSKYIAEFVVIAFWIEESGTIIRIVDTRFFTVSVLFVRDIGTKAFLTKEQAEQALKERESK